MDRKLRQFHKRKQNPPKVVEKKQRLRMMHAELSIEEQIQLAANNKLYTNRNPEKGIRVITVLLYFLSISLAAIILSCYYVYFWHPEYKNATMVRNVNCEIVKEISLRTVNATELFYNKLLHKLRQSERRQWHHKRHKVRGQTENDELDPFESEQGMKLKDFDDGDDEASTRHNEIEMSDEQKDDDTGY